MNRDHQAHAFVRVVWYFVALAFVLIGGAMGIQQTVDETQPPIDVELQILLWMAGLDTVMTLIVIRSLYSIPTNPIPPPRDSHRNLAGVLFVPLLLGMLAGNVLYHYALREILQLDSPHVDIMTTSFWLPLKIVLFCVQPAIVEELFFRRVALEAVWETGSPVWAILITSLLFALAHLGQPLSLPVLGVMGLILGYLRVASGTLWLPILFHFLHNLAVLFLGILNG